MLEGYKTLIGAIVALAAEGARLAGVDIGDQQGLVNSILVIFGGILAIYGRMKASGPIGG
jgi:hypothetical protein